MHLGPQIAKARRGGQRGKVNTAVISDDIVKWLNKLRGKIRITEKQAKVTKYIVLQNDITRQIYY